MIFTHVFFNKADIANTSCYPSTLHEVKKKLIFNIFGFNEIFHFVWAAHFHSENLSTWVTPSIEFVEIIKFFEAVVSFFNPLIHYLDIGLFLLKNIIWCISPCQYLQYTFHSTPYALILLPYRDDFKQVILYFGCLHVHSKFEQYIKIFCQYIIPNFMKKIDLYRSIFSGMQSFEIYIK